jgi:hypothetical protein
MMNVGQAPQQGDGGRVEGYECALVLRYAYLLSVYFWRIS